jgi:hypothetical protein
MKMKKNFGLLVFCISMVALISLGSCATLNEQNYAKGKFIYVLLLDRYNSSKPVEEQSYLINLSIWGKIGTIDGAKVRNKMGEINSNNTSLCDRSVMILPPGKHTFGWGYIPETGVNINAGTYKIANGNIEAELLPGHYYFFQAEEVGNNQVKTLIDDIENHTEIMVYGVSIFSKEKMPIATIIEGINAKIRTKIPGFKK